MLTTELTLHKLHAGKKLDTVGTQNLLLQCTQIYTCVSLVERRACNPEASGLNLVLTIHFLHCLKFPRKLSFIYLLTVYVYNEKKKEGGGRKPTTKNGISGKVKQNCLNFETNILHLK